MEDNYDWVGIKKDVENYIKKCVECAKMKTIEKSKREKSITILSHGPKDRYVADLWYLPEYLKGHSNYLYVLDIIDHFSKFCNSYLLNTKEKYEIFTHIKDFIENYGKPNYLVTDNGTEFKNNLLSEYCKENEIKFIHGLPYRPHSQGVVERLHRVIKRGLNSYKLKLKKAYNIDYAIAEIVKIKNNTYCRTTKETPNNLFFKELTEEEIKTINLKMLESQKYSNIYKNTFNLKEKILLNENFKIENKTLKKRNNKFGLWSITAEIIKIYSANSYKIKISENYKDILKKDEEYYTNINLIKKVNDSVWKIINQENQEKMRKHLENIYGKNMCKEDIEYDYSSADDSNISDSNFGCSEDEELIMKSISK